MKKLSLALVVAAAAFAVSNCKSIDKTKISGKDAVVATQASPVIFTALGATAQSCIDALSAEGVTEVKSANGISENAPFLSRLSGFEMCQATGTK